MAVIMHLHIRNEENNKNLNVNGGFVPCPQGAGDRKGKWCGAFERTYSLNDL